VFLYQWQNCSCPCDLSLVAGRLSVIVGNGNTRIGGNIGTGAIRLFVACRCNGDVNRKFFELLPLCHAISVSSVFRHSEEVK